MGDLLDCIEAATKQRSSIRGIPCIICNSYCKEIICDECKLYLKEYITSTKRYREAMNKKYNLNGLTLFQNKKNTVNNDVDNIQ